MEPTKELADAIYCERVKRARKLSTGERLATCIELFEGATGMMRDGIRHQFPRLDREAVEAELRRRLGRLRQLHEHGIYRPVKAD